MGNQAHQSRELELWQVVGPDGNRNVQAGPAKPKRTDLQIIPDLQKRGEVSNYNRVRTGNSGPRGVARTGNSRPAGTARTGNSRPAGAARTGTPRSAEQIRMINPNTQGTAGRRAGVKRADMSGTGVRRSATARSAYAQPSGYRTSPPRTGAKAGTYKYTKKVGRRGRISQFLAVLWIAAMCAAIFFMGKAFYQSRQTSPVLKTDMSVKAFSEEIPVVEDDEEKKPKILEDFLTVSEYNRPGTKLACVNNIFVHYTANPGTSAAQNRSYFESLGQTHERAASAHFIIGYEGEIVQCIPLEEEAYAVVERNGDSISIECCFLAEDGSFTQATYDSLVEMLAWLTDKYDLGPQDILRHYDCGGKLCPIYYVEHEDAWQKLLDDVAHYTL